VKQLEEAGAKAVIESDCPTRRLLKEWVQTVFWVQDYWIWVIFGGKNLIFGREPEILTEKKRGFLREELGLKHWDTIGRSG
jgi:hypothetical protein